MLYRAWQPYISETMARHISARGSGNYGTGVYAYCSLDRAKGDHVDVYAIDTARLRMFEPTKLDPLRYLGKHLNRAVRADANNDADEVASALRDAHREARDIPLSITPDDLTKAVQKTAQCFTSFESMQQCSQPINHLFIAKGFDGIKPMERLCNENDYGAVIFAESITTQPFVEGRSIPVGKKIT